MKRVVAASILSVDYANMKEQIQILNESKAKWIHYDVMDGHFVPNITFGQDLLKGFRAISPLFLDVHLMISDPRKYAKNFVDAGADLVSFHVEAMDNDISKIKECLDYIHSLGCKTGIVVKPKTAIEPFESLLPSCDLVLVMTVEPGFGGQSFMEPMLDKVRYLNAVRNEKGYNYRIEVDGGICDKTVQQCVDAGVDTLVAGSYVFNGDIKERVASLL